ncbi:MAG: Rne/Rng family ribonuclease, partial [Sciscionella sp.]
MSNMDVPAEDNGGGSGTPVDPALTALPERVRVHALARLIGKSSRQVLEALSGLGEPARSAQSSVPKSVALQVAQVLGVGEPAADTESAEAAETVGAAEPVAGEQSAAQQRQTGPPQRSAALTPVFTAPAAVFLPPSPVASPETRESGDTGQRAGGTASDQEVSDSEGPDDDTEDGSRRRRRRGRRGRGRGRGGQNEDGTESEEPADQAEFGVGEGQGKAEKQDKQPKQGKQPKGGKRDAEDDTPDAESTDAEQGSSASTDTGDSGDEDTDGGSRRRRRRRRRKSGVDDSSAEVDPPNTVTHVRDVRDKQDQSRDEVRSVRGSTRLEAKRQRRRDGRDAGRRRVPVLSEAEFLARRESVDRKMVVREHGDQVQIGVLEDDVLVEHFVTTAGSGSLVGNVYLGRVQNVLPSMEAAFVDIGRGRNAVLYAGEVDWDSAGLEGKARKIEQALSTGDSVLVQVTKDPVGHKGARLTTQISLPGRFLVYVPGGGATGISRKLPDTERKRLKDILKRVVPSDAGVIVRTASEGVAEEELDRDVCRLQAQWEVIHERAQQKSTKAPQLLYEEPDLLIKVVRDMFTEDFSALVVAGSNAWETIDAYVRQVAPDLAERLKRHTANTEVFADYRIDEQIVKALDRKVWLPSGGYLIIDRTEAMTVIDVNTGKFTGSGGNLEETVTRNNLEAAEEVVRQLRL